MEYMRRSKLRSEARRIANSLLEPQLRPELPEARPKPRLLGQAGPEHHYRQTQDKDERIYPPMFLHLYPDRDDSPYCHPNREDGQPLQKILHDINDTERLYATQTVCVQLCSQLSAKYDRRRWSCSSVIGRALATTFSGGVMWIWYYDWFSARASTLVKISRNSWCCGMLYNASSFTIGTETSTSSHSKLRGNNATNSISRTFERWI
ncbi:uncharacterized protein F5891DRAFT_287022 [Suillus fuscotomentosus]|uniref:Uncharacterized protein n=1 Tax=Suillus fuscotomentosus TaxID=1912939 RepID=A0AAD4E723_9AGAM|nr:uncharacterized protein F5891DRAFT_287022 [Suillus fuscotomentosus]KAG1900770.1 hypothetical protein F5891DRAFT_287022 [Suillus fuscotomentosus]